VSELKYKGIFGVFLMEQALGGLGRSVRCDSPQRRRRRRIAEFQLFEVGSGDVVFEETVQVVFDVTDVPALGEGFGQTPDGFHELGTPGAEGRPTGDGSEHFEFGFVTSRTRHHPW